MKLLTEDREVRQLRSLLKGKKNIVIIPHQKPDGDAMGASLGLYNLLIQKSHSVNVISPTDYPHFLKWMPADDKVVVYNEEPGRSERLLKEADVIFCLDFNKLHRIHKMADHVKSSEAKVILIDHHLDPDDFADFQLCNSLASATCELLYDFIHILGEEHLINKEVATCLYAGIMTDTGSFRYNSTSSKVHGIVADLINYGADNHRIYEAIYDSFSTNRLRFFGYCFLEKLKVMPEYKAALISVTADELKRFEIGTGDTEGLVNYPLSINDIDLAGLFIERGDIVKISFRSKGDFSVNDMARMHFEGGGHRNAAGGKSDTSLNETIQKFISILPHYKNFLVSS